MFSLLFVVGAVATACVLVFSQKINAHPWLHTGLFAAWAWIWTFITSGFWTALVCVAVVTPVIGFANLRGAQSR